MGQHKTHLTGAYFELKDDNELNKNHVGFVADDNTDHPHVKEAHMSDAMNNLSNAVMPDATNLTNLTITYAHLVEQPKVALSQNKVLTDLLRKKISVSQQLSQKIRAQIKVNALTRQGGMRISQSHKKTV